MSSQPESAAPAAPPTPPAPPAGNPNAPLYGIAGVIVGGIMIALFLTVGMLEFGAFKEKSEGVAGMFRLKPKGVLFKATGLQLALGTPAFSETELDSFVRPLDPPADDDSDKLAAEKAKLRKDFDLPEGVGASDTLGKRYFDAPWPGILLWAYVGVVGVFTLVSTANALQAGPAVFRGHFFALLMLAAGVLAMGLLLPVYYVGAAPPAELGPVFAKKMGYSVLPPAFVPVALGFMLVCMAPLYVLTGGSGKGKGRPKPPPIGGRKAFVPPPVG